MCVVLQIAAMFGLRAMFFLIDRLVVYARTHGEREEERDACLSVYLCVCVCRPSISHFVLLKYGLCIILIFIGVRLILAP